MPLLHVEKRRQSTPPGAMKTSVGSSPPTAERSCSVGSTATPGSNTHLAARAEGRLGCVSVMGAIVDMDAMSEYRAEQVHLLQTRVIDMDCRVWDAMRRVEEVSGVASSVRGASNYNKERVRELEKRLEVLEAEGVIRDTRSAREMGDVEHRMGNLEDKVRSLHEAVRCFDVHDVAKHSVEVAAGFDRTPCGLAAGVGIGRPREPFSLCQAEVDGHRGGDLEDVVVEVRADAGDAPDVLGASPDFPQVQRHGPDPPINARLDRQAELMDSVLRRLTRVEGRVQIKRLNTELGEDEVKPMDLLPRGANRPCEYFSLCAEEVPSPSGGVDRSVSFREPQPEPRRLDSIQDLLIEDLDAKVTARLDNQAEALEAVFERLKRMESCCQNGDLNSRLDSQAQTTESMLQRLKQMENCQSGDLAVRLDSQAQAMDSMMQRLTQMESRQGGDINLRLDSQAQAMDSMMERLTQMEGACQIGDLKERLDSQVQAMDSVLQRLTQVESCRQSGDLSSRLDKQPEAMDSLLQRVAQMESECQTGDLNLRLDEQAQAMDSILQRVTQMEGCCQCGDLNVRWRESQSRAMELILRRLESMEHSCPRTQRDLDTLITAKMEKSFNERMASFMARAKDAVAEKMEKAFNEKVEAFRARSGDPVAQTSTRRNELL